MPLDMEVKLGESALGDAIRTQLAQEGLEATGDVRWSTQTLPDSTKNERENVATVQVRTASTPSRQGASEAKAVYDQMLGKAALEGMHSMLETILKDEKQGDEGMLNTVARLQRELGTYRRLLPTLADAEHDGNILTLSKAIEVIGGGGFEEQWAAWCQIRNLLWNERGDEDFEVDGVGGVSLIRFQRLLDEVRRYREMPTSEREKWRADEDLMQLWEQDRAELDALRKQFRELKTVVDTAGPTMREVVHLLRTRFTNPFNAEHERPRAVAKMLEEWLDAAHAVSEPAKPEATVAHGAPTWEPEKPKTGTAELLNALEMKAFFTQLPEAPERTRWSVCRADPRFETDEPKLELRLIVHNGDPDDGDVILRQYLTIFPTQSATFAVGRTLAQLMLKFYAEHPEIHPPDPNAPTAPKADQEDKLAKDPEWQQICADMGSPLETPDEPHVTELVDTLPTTTDLMAVENHPECTEPAEEPARPKVLDAVEKTRQKMREGMAKGVSKIKDRAAPTEPTEAPEAPATMEIDYPAN